MTELSADVADKIAWLVAFVVWLSLMLPSKKH